MSVRKCDKNSYYIQCDECGFEDLFYGVNKWKARDDAKLSGWDFFEFGKDLCPECVSNVWLHDRLNRERELKL